MIGVFLCCVLPKVVDAAATTLHQGTCGAIQALVGTWTAAMVLVPPTELDSLMKAPQIDDWRNAWVALCRKSLLLPPLMLLCLVILLELMGIVTNLGKRSLEAGSWRQMQVLRQGRRRKMDEVSHRLLLYS